MTLARFIQVFALVSAAVGFLAGQVLGAPAEDQAPVPHAHTAAKGKKPVAKMAAKPAGRTESNKERRKAEKSAKPGKERKEANRTDERHREGGGRASVPPLPAAAPRFSSLGSRLGPAPLPAERFVAPTRPFVPLAVATTAMTSPIDLTAVKQAIELVHKGRAEDATNVEKTISDPLARKLVEWVILRSDETTVEFSRYAAFIAANPTWPSMVTLRLHAEAALWEQQIDPETTIGFFAKEPPRTAKGHFALARAWLIKGDSGRANAAIGAAWRDTGFSEELEEQARAKFAGLITPADDKARMDARFYLGDDDAAMRAAHHLDAVNVAIAHARDAVNHNAGNAKDLLAAVPAAGQHDPGYIFSLIQYLRRNNNIKDAAQWMLSAPRDPGQLINLDQWWIERRLIARKLLDLGEPRTAYEVAAGAAPPPTENYRADQQFTAGWIALEFLHDPAIALTHFARLADGVINPITLARSYYWQGRAARALGREQDAHGYFEAAARYPTAYYGQLARAELGLNEITLRDLQVPPASSRPLELGRAFEILYAVDQPDLVATMAADVADKSTDSAALVTLAGITARHNDARATLLIGKIALGRGLPLARYAFPDFGVPNYRQIGPPVERCVVYSIVRQESAFNPRDRSSANALGLMQVTPAAGRDTARRFKVPFDERRLMTDVPYNAELGSAELGNDLASWRGSYILAFVAYNAGPRRAEEWIQQYGDPRDRRVDPVDWIERIPIAETRNYVERVLENMQVYRARLDNNSRLMIAADLRRGG